MTDYIRCKHDSATVFVPRKNVSSVKVKDQKHYIKTKGGDEMRVSASEFGRLTLVKKHG